MAFQKVEFEFPEDDDGKLVIEGTSAVEIDVTGRKTKEDFTEVEEQPKAKVAPADDDDDDDDDLELEIIDDTPKADRGR